jgi:diaminopimelate decarboxylase
MKAALQLVLEEGMSCEAASPGELEQALRAGFTPDRIVYDEPSKTSSILERVLDLGVALNIDNFQELERVESLLEGIPLRSRIGIRINPQVGAGEIGAMSTATERSKFGVALEDEGNRQALLDAYRRHSWLTAVHCHVGSQGCNLDLMGRGVRKTVDLALDINAWVGIQQVDVVDIGGGLPVNFGSDRVTPTFADYSKHLRGLVPELFSGDFQVLTEFGRSIFAKNGFIASRVEYTKTSGGRRIAATHAGAQVATRTVFMPDHWKLRVSVFNSKGALKEGDEGPCDIAGPLCFAGDLVASGIPMPMIEPGDYVALHDTGAYYFSNPFYYNAFPAPPVYGVSAAGSGSLGFTTWRREQTLEEMLNVIG